MHYCIFEKLIGAIWEVYKTPSFVILFETIDQEIHLIKMCIQKTVYLYLLFISVYFCKMVLAIYIYIYEIYDEIKKKNYGKE